MKSTRMPSLNWSRSAGIALTVALVTVCCPAARAEDWTGATSNDWNDPTNWVNGVVPDGTTGNEAAGIFSATGNIATISSDITAMPAEILVAGYGNTGRLDHVAGTLNTQNVGWPPGWMLIGIGPNGNGTYNLADTATTGGTLTGYGTGSGTLNLADSLFMGEPNGSGDGTGVATLNVNTTGALNVTFDMNIGVSGWNATVNVDAGTVQANVISLAKTQNAQTTASNGTLNVSGGSVISNFRVTLAGGGVNNSATVNQDGGTVSILADGLSVASATGDGNGGTATYNLNGGTLSAPHVFSEDSGANTKGTSTFNFNGGTLKAIQTDGGFLQSLTRANVRNGGAIIDTNGFDVTIAQALVHSDIGGDNAVDGGLTKRGVGTLTLTGANTFTGDIHVEVGTLALDSAGSMKFTLGANGVGSKITGAGSVILDGTFNLDLSGAAIANGNQWQLVDTGFASLVYNPEFTVSGFTNNAGDWTMTDGNNTWTFSQSTGVLGLAVVPEPATYAMFLFGLCSLLVLRRRRRA